MFNAELNHDDHNTINNHMNTIHKAMLRTPRL